MSRKKLRIASVRVGWRDSEGTVTRHEGEMRLYEDTPEMVAGLLLAGAVEKVFARPLYCLAHALAAYLEHYSSGADFRLPRQSKAADGLASSAKAYLDSTKESAA